jgi:regulator of sirC expression with transglutaminase-like and TPR domain
METSNSPLCFATTVCRHEAYDHFVRWLPKVDSCQGLLHAAIAISMHALDDIDPYRVEQRLKILSLRVLERSPSRRPAAILANLHAVLFDEEKFTGNMKHYYNALNSYLPAVLNSRCGVPISMSLLYKVVAEGAGLSVLGVNAPGHFLVRVRCDNAWIIVDPFFGGQMLKREEAFERLEKVLQRPLPRTDAMLATPTHAQWLTRILGNLRQIFAEQDRQEDLAAMNEFAAALSAAESAPARGVATI